MNRGNYRGAYTECNSKQQSVFSLFSSPNQQDQCFGFLKGVFYDTDEEIFKEELLNKQGNQLANFQQKQKFSVQKRLFNDKDSQQEELYDNYQEDEIQNNQTQNRRLQDIFEQKNVGVINHQQYQRNLFGQQQYNNYNNNNHQYAQTVYKEKQDNESSILNLNVRSSRNLLSSFQQIQHKQKSTNQEDEEYRNQPIQDIFANQEAHLKGFGDYQYHNRQQTNEQIISGFGKRLQKNQYLTDQINQTGSQSSLNSSYKKEQSQSQLQNNIFAQFQNQQKIQQQINLSNKQQSSQHQQQQLIEMNRFKGFQTKKNDFMFQTQTQLSSASSQNQQSSNKENSQNTSHSSTSSSGISLQTYSDYQPQTNNSSESSQSLNTQNNQQKQSQFHQQQQQQQQHQQPQQIQTPSSQKKLQQQLQKEVNPKIFQIAQARTSTYQTNFIPLKQQQSVSSDKNYCENQQNFLQKQMNHEFLSKPQFFDNSLSSKPQNSSTSSSSLSSSQSQIQSSTHPSCSSPSSQSSCSSEAYQSLRNLSISSKAPFPTSSSRIQNSNTEYGQNRQQQNLQTPQQNYNQNMSTSKGQKQFGSSGKKPFGKTKQMVYYEKQQSSNSQYYQPQVGAVGSQSIPFQTPIKQEQVTPNSIAACQEDNYQNQYGFNSPLYTPNTLGKLHRIKESSYESTPINEFKQLFAKRIKQLRQDFKDNCKTPDGNQFNAGPSSNITSIGSSILQKEIKQKLTFIEILGTSIAKLCYIKPNMYWKLMFELADFAKKDCMYHEAKYFYKIAINLQPFCSDIWLEYAKMEEDYGNLQKAKEILENAYPFCKMSDSLVLKLLRIIEKIGTIEDVRRILCNLNQLKLEKCWKIYIEGAFIEIRFGNLKNAERILKMLHHYLDLNGQVCYEYARVLELQGKFTQALQICQQAQEKGLKCTSLWTLYLKLYEKTCVNVESQVLDKFIRLANQSLPKEIIWKIHLEIAQICEKKKEINLAKQYLIMSIRNAHESMRWKPLIQVAKIELLLGNKDNANKIIQKTLDTCSEKQKPYLIIEAAKCAEIAGDVPSALTQMESLKSYMKSEWKIYMEYISMLIRNKKHKEAAQIIKESLHTHTLAGRLWGELIQLEHIKATNNDLNSAFEFFLVALEEVPKSGEVWCEGARLCMNPFGNKYDLQKAKQFLECAIFFTPQYGDSFIEAYRLYTILGEREQIKQLKNKTIISQPNYGHLWYYMKDTTRDTSIDVWKKMKIQIQEEVNKTFVYYQNRMISMDISSSLKQQTPMITALTEYNDLFFFDKIPQEIRWKTIFYLDQSLNQI